MFLADLLCVVTVTVGVLTVSSDICLQQFKTKPLYNLGVGAYISNNLGWGFLRLSIVWWLIFTIWPHVNSANNTIETKAEKVSKPSCRCHCRELNNYSCKVNLFSIKYCETNLQTMWLEPKQKRAGKSLFDVIANIQEQHILLVPISLVVVLIKYTNKQCNWN